MAQQNYRQIHAIKDRHKKEILKVNPNIDNGSGIYFLTRIDENGFRYAYIGQAVKILDRLVSHMEGYQHIDLSIKKHKLYGVDNPHGWKIGFLHYPESKLDEMEQFYIKQYADSGYQLRNKTSGSQGEGKAQIADYKEPKGYRQGIAQGRKSLAKELKHIIDTHLEVSLKKPNNKVSEKALQKFNYLLDESTYLDEKQ